MFFFHKSTDDKAKATVVNNIFTNTPDSEARDAIVQVQNWAPIFDGDATTPYIENAPTNPLGVYGQTKLNGELAVSLAQPEALIIRTVAERTVVRHPQIPHVAIRREASLHSITVIPRVRDHIPLQ